MQDYELFDDNPFWNLPDDAFEINGRPDVPGDENDSSNVMKLPICNSCKCAKICKCDSQVTNENGDKTLEENGPYLTMNI